MSITFQGVNPNLTDYEVYQFELAQAVKAESLGFDSVWATEHHFTGYQMVPSPMEFLSYVAGATTKIRLGTMVTVVPWHDPYRIAIEASMLDNMSGGRFMLGLGRGLGKKEFDRFRIPMDESRQRFTEHAAAILQSLESGVFELDGTFIQQMRSPLRPKPFKTFQGRTFIAGESPATMPFAAEFGAGPLVLPTSGWDKLAKSVRIYEESWEEQRPGTPRPRPVVVGYTFVDRDADRAKEMAHKYIADYYRGTIDHYELNKPTLNNVGGYDHYKSMTASATEDPDKFVHDFADQMIWGTPEQVVEKIADVRKKIDAGTFIAHFSYAGIPHEDVLSSQQLFADEVIPVLHSWNVSPTVTPALAAAQ